MYLLQKASNFVLCLFQWKVGLDLGGVLAFKVSS